MKTIILKWNPAFSSYTLLRFLKNLQLAWERDDEGRKSNWSVWDYDKVSEGDLFYLLKVGYGQTGIVARGRVTSNAYLDEDWTPNNKPRYYVDYDLERLCMDLYSFGINFRNWVNLINPQTDNEEE